MDVVAAIAVAKHRADLTGLFWTRPYERIGLAKELGNAEKAI
jgi:hypothetical protein